MDAGVYKVEAVSDNGYAYFNIPLSRSVFWSVVAPVTPMDISTFRTDSSTVETSLISSINSLRI